MGQDGDGHRRQHRRRRGHRRPDRRQEGRAHRRGRGWWCGDDLGIDEALTRSRWQRKRETGGAGGGCPLRRPCHVRAPSDDKMSVRMADAPDQPLPNVPIIHRPDRTLAGSSLARPPLQERKRLLVVDDEAPVLRLVARILATDNYDVVSAESGQAALRLLQQPGSGGVDLLVTDLMMPGMNGRELAAAVRKTNPQVHVLYITGFADTLFTGVKELEARESFIEKPFGA